MAAGPVERAQTGWRLRLLYPLGGAMPPLRAVPRPLRRAARRRGTELALRVGAYRRAGTRIAAVTGSTAKTTTKDLIGAMLASAGPTVVTRENDNGLYGVPASLLAIRPGDAFAVIEAGIAEPGDMRWMAGLIEPDVAVLTGIGQDHLDRFGSREAIAREKQHLLDRVVRGGVVVVTADDEVALAAAARSGQRVVTAGRALDADVRVVATRLVWPHGCEVTLAVDGQRLTGQTRLFGAHQAAGVALAVAAARELGVPPHRALAAAGRVPPREGRLSLRPGPCSSLLLMDEHKSRPLTTAAALRTLAALPARRRIAVLGEPQDFDPADAAALKEAASLAGEHADLVIAVGDAAATYAALGVVVVAAARPSDAAAILREALRPGDVALVHGAIRQHLLRVALRLDSAEPICDVARCTLHWRCTTCPHLRGGPPARVVERA